MSNGLPKQDGVGLHQSSADVQKLSLEIFSQELSSASAKQYLHEAQAAADVMRPAGSRDGDFHRPAFELKVGSQAGESCRAGCIGLRLFPSSFGHQSQTANAL